MSNKQARENQIDKRKNQLILAKLPGLITSAIPKRIPMLHAACTRMSPVCHLS